MRLVTALPVDAEAIAMGNGYHAFLLPYHRHPRVFEVVYHRVLVGCIFKLIRPHRTLWQCSICDMKLHNRADMIQHHIFAHFATACQVFKVGAKSILPVGYVPDHSDRARMPWRVDAPEYR